jgi:hypothetical protein
MATFLWGYRAEAQTSTDLIKPGDIPIIKVLYRAPQSPLSLVDRLLVTKTLVVNSDGKITPPPLKRLGRPPQGLGPIEDVSVESLSLLDATQRVLENYVAAGVRVSFPEAELRRAKIVIERRTFGELLSQ